MLRHYVISTKAAILCVKGGDSLEVGFIGTGSMGTILIEALIHSKAIPPTNIKIINRTIEKTKSLKNLYPELVIADSLEELIIKCQAVFICVRPGDYPEILKELQKFSHSEQIVVSITSALLIEDLENCIPSKIIKLIPSITNAALSGATLLMYSERLTPKERNDWQQIFSTFSTPLVIEERFVRVSSDITSCGPAFFSYLLDHFIEGAVLTTGIPREHATLLATEMIIGLGKLFSNATFTLDTLQERVRVPGGVTGVGLDVLREEIGSLFEHLFQKTHEKFKQDLEEGKKGLQVF